MPEHVTTGHIILGILYLIGQTIQYFKAKKMHRENKDELTVIKAHLKATCNCSSDM